MYDASMNKITELFGISTYQSTQPTAWTEILNRQFCPYLERTCLKVRKSTPEVAIGTCSVLYHKERMPVVICPYRFLEKRKIFLDCLHLLTLHEPGNELHVVPEVPVPGGTVDYCLTSTRNGRARDFVALEVQTLDTTGTVWPERQRLLSELGVISDADDTGSAKSFGMNWKMTAKTTLIQLHHKIQTFENMSKRLVLVIQDHFLHYMQRQFRFDRLVDARIGDSMHIHAYELLQTNHGAFQLALRSRHSTDANGVAESLGLKASPRVELAEILRVLESKLSEQTLLEWAS